MLVRLSVGYLPCPAPAPPVSTLQRPVCPGHPCSMDAPSSPWVQFIKPLS